MINIMKVKTTILIILLLAPLCCFVHIHSAPSLKKDYTVPSTKTETNISRSVTNKSEWIEIGEVRMNAFVDDNWHWVTASLYQFNNASMVYKVLYEDKYYTVRTKIIDNVIKCSVWILYCGEKTCFYFDLPINGCGLN